MERRRRQLTDLPYLDIRRQMVPTPRLTPSSSGDALTMYMMVQPAQGHLHASFSLPHSMGTFSYHLPTHTHTLRLLEQAHHLVFTFAL